MNTPVDLMKHYPTSSMTLGGYKVIERQDFSHTTGGSYKAYICTIQQQVGVTVPSKERYRVICFYGRISSRLTQVDLGEFDNVSTALMVLRDKANKKLAKGYAYHATFDSKLIQELSPAVINFLKEKYPLHARIESPTGNTATIVGYYHGPHSYSDHVGLKVRLYKTEEAVCIRWEKLGAYKVI